MVNLNEYVQRDGIGCPDSRATVVFQNSVNDMY